jgi:hypothetical protein
VYFDNAGNDLSEAREDHYFWFGDEREHTIEGHYVNESKTRALSFEKPGFDPTTVVSGAAFEQQLSDTGKITLTFHKVERHTKWQRIADMKPHAMVVKAGLGMSEREIVRKKEMFTTCMG